MDYDLRIIAERTWSSEFRVAWVRLFSRCYGVSESKAVSVMEKYELNESWCSAMYVDDVLVGCYSGLVLRWNKNRVFLSTDTMSDGSVRGGTVKMAVPLYEKLAEAGFALVLGYPNDNIRKIRQRKLGWAIEGGLYGWLGLPIISSFLKKQTDNGLWSVRRPGSGFFGARFPLLKLQCRFEDYGSLFGIPFTLAATRPGPFFVKVPEFLISRKTFGYRVLGDHGDIVKSLRERLTQLDIDTIDLP